MVPLNQKIVPLIFFYDNLIKKKRIKNGWKRPHFQKGIKGGAKICYPLLPVILESGKCAQFSLDEKKTFLEDLVAPHAKSFLIHF